MALTDTLDDLISDERINPQLAMKILGNFDQAITEALQKEVKARLTFKVSLRYAPPWKPSLPARRKGSGLTEGGRTGQPGHVPVLRRSLDFLDPQCRFQDGRVEPNGLGGQGQDR